MVYFLPAEDRACMALRISMFPGSGGKGKWQLLGHAVYLKQLFINRLGTQ
jgi:hypothetical protein